MRDRGEVSIKGKGKMQCFWVNEKNERRNSALEKLEMKRSTKLLESSIQNWATFDIERGGNEDLPEQAPDKARRVDLAPVKEMSGEMSADFSMEGSLDFDMKHRFSQSAGHVDYVV